MDMRGPVPRKKHGWKRVAPSEGNKAIFQNKIPEDSRNKEKKSNTICNIINILVDWLYFFTQQFLTGHQGGAVMHDVIQ